MSVLVAMPCYQGVMHIGAFRSLLGNAQVCGNLDIPMDMLVSHGESAITRGRSNIAATFLGAGYDTLCMLDSDIEIRPEDFLKLLRLEKPVRGAAVNLKTTDLSECLSVFIDGVQIERDAMPSEPFEVDYIGGSVMLIEREVIETLSNKHHGLAYNDPINGPGVHLFHETVAERSLWTEDYAFCRRARSAGYSIWCEPSVIVGHHEGRMVWRH